MQQMEMQLGWRCGRPATEAELQQEEMQQAWWSLIWEVEAKFPLFHDESASKSSPLPLR
jgi:hypothetical protein